ncbi:MAG: thioredoxin [Lachnospiraceae bacterium]|nr:thioredoxin [Lachnospiraceae bacterium]
MVQVVTDATFEAEVLKSEVPVVVDFFAVWCGPCRMLAPVLDKMSNELEGKVKFVKIDIDQNRAAETYRIQAVPTMKMFVGGKVVDEVVGMNPALLTQKVQALL